MTPTATRYDGLDLVRGLSMFSVVLLHVHVLALGDRTDWILRIRDFAFPVLIMGSFFVLALSFDRKPARPFSAVVRARVLRLLVPSLVWSYLYWVMWWIVRPWLIGQSPVWPPLSLALTSYMHLWFLHLVFAMTVLLSPMLGWVARGRLPRGPVLAGCVAATLGCAVWLEPRLADAAARLAAQADLVAYPAPNLGILMAYIAPFVAFAPAGLAIGLARPMIDRWHQSLAFRRGTVIAALLACAVHLSPVRVPLSREMFSIVIFLAILRPVAARPFVLARALARWSFVVYILHFGIVIAWQTAFELMHLQRSALTSIAGAAAVVLLSLLAGMMLRRLLPFNWLLPLVEVTAPSRPAAPSGIPS